LCDLLWSDPEPEVQGWVGEKKIILLELIFIKKKDNERGVSYVFGPDVCASFLKKQDMDLICRAHQVC